MTDYTSTSPLTLEQYRDAVDSIVSAGVALMKSGVVSEAMSIAANLSKHCWELTRPGVEYRVYNLTPMIPTAAVPHIVEAEFHIVIDEESNALLGWGVVTGHDGTTHRGNEGGLPDHVVSALDTMFSAHEALVRESGVKMDDVTSLDAVMAKHVNKTVDQQVDEFRSELDDLFSTWEGGDK